MASESEVHSAGASPEVPTEGWRKRLLAMDSNWLELFAVVLLAIASLGVAWSGYQAARWGGVQSTLYSQAGAARVESTREQTVGYLFAIADLQIFNGWAEAYAADDELLLTFYENRFSPELRVAVDAWLKLRPLQNPDAPSGPLQMEEYVRPELVRADELQQAAERLFDEGKQANQQSDDYVLTTVFLAMVLFFAGLATRLAWQPVRLGVTIFALAMLVYGVIRLATFPVQ
jgi:hypothetical protein